MITFRNATFAELAMVLDWAANEGWNPGLDDAAAFLAADPKGFFVAEDASGAPLAAISVVNHSDDFAFLGLYIVRPEHRGKGIGLGLWQHSLQHAGDRTVGLDGVQTQQKNYAASGFSHAGGTTRFSGVIHGKADPDIRTADTQDVPWMIEKEAVASGAAKIDYLRAWFAPTESRTTLVLKETGTYCTVRQCRSGFKIGPLLAESSAEAHRLIAHAASLFDGPALLDVPQSSTVLRELCHGLELEEGFKTARMYRGPFAAKSHACFAVASLELG